MANQKESDHQGQPDEEDVWKINPGARARQAIREQIQQDECPGQDDREPGVPEQGLHHGQPPPVTAIGGCPE
jgi:hypothetical protein